MEGGPKPDVVDRLVEQWAEQRPDLDLAPMATVARLLRVAGLLRAELERTAGEHGLDVPEGDILFTLRRAGPPYRLSPSQLSASLLVSSGTMTSRLDRLERKGLIERVAHPTDRRSTEVALSEEGLDLVERAVGAHVRREAELISALSGRRREQLDSLTRTLLAGLEERRGEGS